MEIDPEKQFIEDEEVINDAPKEKIKKDLTEYALVATVAKNNMVLMWEWKPISEAKSYVNDLIKKI